MEIEICSAVYAAREHKPVVPTLMIRLFSSEAFLKRCMGSYFKKAYPPLKNRKKYVNVLEYEFDDYDIETGENLDELKKDPLLRGIVFFERPMARKILEDFSKYGERASAMVVHCLMGQRRSPAVGMALNEVFNLGAEGIDESRYPRFNRYVYTTMLEVAREIGI